MYAMLSLDLERNVTDEQRKKFYEHLKEENWVKIPKVTTTWRASFKQGTTEVGALNTTKKDVANAAKKARIGKYNAVVHFGPSKPNSFP